MNGKLTATAEFVVPKSMPTTRLEGWGSSGTCAAQFRVILLPTERNCRHSSDLLTLERGETQRFFVIVDVGHKLLRGTMPLIFLGTRPQNPKPPGLASVTD